MFRRLLTRETAAAPWRELTRVYRRLEARGEIRGGRFVSGMAGEQFALPDAVPVLREVRRTPPSGAIHAISTADPLNLAGIVTAGARVCARAGRNRIAYRDGVPVAVLENQVFRALVPLDAADTAAAASALSRKRTVRPHLRAAGLARSRRHPWSRTRSTPPRQWRGFERRRSPGGHAIRLEFAHVRTIPGGRWPGRSCCRPARRPRAVCRSWTPRNGAIWPPCAR